ncbi:MAG: ATP-grasp domain-containing protein [Oceanicaulis sp.]|uniref:ATP-grasp domain-containing protein n=1 Tax=Glycocaulis sp. TaxID=1969725 RepID=UPI0025C6B48B|nr:ATP-grasp domain-containing protein [Glycocaulis sp.]MCC5982030.1 ATP-grasp domain-containing protein [Oceanicaulis sp.]MCH8520448.1 ATP-grasp domain-containing protein [Glycocaulis sp.]
MRALAIGAGREQADPIAIARALGAEVLALDGRADAEGAGAASSFAHVDLMDAEAVLKIAAEFRPDFLVPAPLARPLITAGIVNDALGLKGVTGHAARLANDKQAMREAFVGAGVPMARQISVGDAAGLRAAAEMLGFPLIVKPRSGSGSRGVALVEREGELPATLQGADWLAEEALTGREIGVDGAVIGGEVRLLSIRWKMLTPAPHRQAISYLARDPAGEAVSPPVATIAAKAFKALRCDNVLFHADMMVSEAGEVSLIELAPRPSGHAIHSAFLPLCYGQNVMESFISLVLMGQVMAPLAFQRPAFFSFLPVPPGRVTAVPDFAGPIAEDGRIAVKCALNAGDRLGPLIDGASALQRGFMVMLTGDELEGMRMAGRLAAAVPVEAI